MGRAGDLVPAGIALVTPGLSDTDKSCQLTPQSGGEQLGNYPRNFEKHVQLLVQLNISAGCVTAC